MIIATLIFFLITLGVLFYPIIIKPRADQPRLESTYQALYIENKKQLDAKLADQSLSQEAYEVQLTLLARDFLAIAENKKSNAPKTFHYLLTSLSLLIPVAAFAYYWSYDYVGEHKQFDNTRIEMQRDLTFWLDNISDQELNSKKEIALITPPPPKSIEKNYFYAFPALNLKSAKTNHTDIRALKLLALMYLDIGNPRTNDLAYEAYRRLYALAPNDLGVNMMLLRFELAANEYKLSERTETLFDQLVANNPKNAELYMLYAPILFDSGKVEKSLAHWKTLRALYAGKPELKGYYDAVEAIIDEVTSGEFQTNNARIIEVMIHKPEPLSLTELPESAVLFVYLIDHENMNPVAASRVPITDTLTFPLKVSLSDLYRIDTKGKFIRDYDHLTVFARITLSGDPGEASSAFETPLIELNKGALKAELTLQRGTQSQEGPQNATKNDLAPISAPPFSLKVTLNKAPNLALEKLPKNAVLFVYLRKAEHHLPIAAVRVPAQSGLTFPLTLSISDANRLVPEGEMLEEIEGLTLSARLSLNGEPTGQAGDIESTIEPLEQGARAASLTLQTIKE